MRIRCSWCADDLGEKCSKCGEPCGFPDAGEEVQCPNPECLHRFVAGVGEETHSICRPCAAKFKAEEGAAHAPR